MVRGREERSRLCEVSEGICGAWVVVGVCGENLCPGGEKVSRGEKVSSGRPVAEPWRWSWGSSGRVSACGWSVGAGGAWGEAT